MPGRRATLIATVLAVVALGIPGMGHAANISVDYTCAGNCHFTPARIHANPGDTIVVNSGASADLEEYAGDGTHFAFHGGGPYTFTFTGGQVWFRDPSNNGPASRLVNGACWGGCGSVTDRTTPPADPYIASPSSGTEVPADFTMTGVSEPWMEIWISRSPSIYWRAHADASGNWSAPVTLPTGTSTLTVKAYDAEYRKSPGVPVTLMVGVTDTQAPVTTIEQPQQDEVILSGRMIISGAASDNVGIIALGVQIGSPSCPTFDCGGYTYFARVPNCTGCTLPSSPGQTIRWEYSNGVGGDGEFIARGWAKDAAGRIGYSETRHFYYYSLWTDCTGTFAVLCL